jgi:hypothetical protein
MVSFLVADDLRKIVMSNLERGARSAVLLCSGTVKQRLSESNDEPKLRCIREQ